ncbi:unnamed protein product [Rotaria sp. Silwood2]|nr:unnamed protein product [Rotaria sp. Silwood2]CAF2935932.1 unnamed protein product [Rotaria sp. Silwood2]CAF3314432.1 unnamed protein product [Rotaria sp. Silwood2]CAF3902913.1 unnamed protein product [Rotaria sp. Silwood2]CAF3989641.1 unnamed protein product [Rotaria sp. Silwood2]
MFNFDTDDEQQSGSDEEIIRLLNGHHFVHRQKKKSSSSNNTTMKLVQHKKLMEFNYLPAFQPVKPYVVHFINHRTLLTKIFTLLDQAKQTLNYTLDVEGDDHTNKSSLIQVEYINDQAEELTVLLFEMAHRPESTTRRFLFIQKLFTMILHPSNTIFTSDNKKRQLCDCVTYQVFSNDLIDSMHTVDIQMKFKLWYNRQFPHDRSCMGTAMGADHPCCHCQHRPYKYIDRRWGLQMAMAKTFGEFLDKQLRRSRWSLGLDQRLYSVNEKDRQLHSSSQLDREKLIHYAVCECSSVTKLAMVINNEWTREQLEQYKNEH